MLAVNCTLFITYPRYDSGRAAEFNQQLKIMQEWGARWQVTSVPEKSQTMIVSRSPTAESALKGRFHFGGLPLSLQETIVILEVKVNHRLRFDCHNKHIAKTATNRVSFLRRVASFLDNSRGRLLFLKTQMRPSLEYTCYPVWIVFCVSDFL